MIKILKNIKASPELGKVCNYKAGEELSKDDSRFSESIKSWFLHNKLAVEIEEPKKEAPKPEVKPEKEALKVEEKSIEKAPENKAIQKVENKSIKKSKGKK